MNRQTVLDRAVPLLQRAKRYYVSRAHGSPRPQYHIREAVQILIRDVAERDVKRKDRFEKFAFQRQGKKQADAGDEHNNIASKDVFKQFRESVDIAIETGLDPRKPNQSLRGSVRLPHGTGKLVRVAAFCNDEQMQAAARDAGASVVGGDELIQSILNGGALEFDRAVATPDMVPKLGRVARILGPRGLLPAAKLGTVAPDIGELVSNQLSGLAPYRTDKKGDIHACVGKAFFGEDKLLDNIRVFMQELVDEKPEGAKGTYLKQVCITATQGKGYKILLPTVDPASIAFMVDEKKDEKEEEDLAA